ncbi:MAG TPA: hypothetical protein DHW02_10040, partial [Ktedonobacter sp.]|nr:hypothetical protein [Ktedonobacter sp.]
MTIVQHGNSQRGASGVSSVSGIISASQTSAVNVLSRQAGVVGVGNVGIAPKFAPTLNEDEAITQARLLKALADPTRLRILNLLSRHEGEVCVFEIV